MVLKNYISMDKNKVIFQKDIDKEIGTAEKCLGVVTPMDHNCPVHGAEAKMKTAGGKKLKKKICVSESEFDKTQPSNKIEELEGERILPTNYVGQRPLTAFPKLVVTGANTKYRGNISYKKK